MERKRAKVIMLPTDKVDDVVMKWRDGKIRNHHLYIVTDDEIKEGDWALSMEEVTKDNPIKGVYPYKVTDVEQVHWDDKKIIATTDPELKYVQGTTPDSAKEWKQIFELPQPSKAFIEKYCKEGGIDKVMVEYEIVGTGEVPFPSNLGRLMELNGQLIAHVPKVNSHNEITIHPIKDSYSKEELIQFVLDNRFKIDSDTTREDVEQWI